MRKKANNKYNRYLLLCLGRYFIISNRIISTCIMSIEYYYLIVLEKWYNMEIKLLNIL